MTRTFNFEEKRVKEIRRQYNMLHTSKWNVSVFSEVDINNKQQVVDRLGLANAGFIRMESLSLN